MRYINNLNPGLAVPKTPATPSKLSPRAMLGVELNVVKPKCAAGSPQQVSPCLTLSPGSSRRGSIPESDRSLTSVSSAGSGPDNLRTDVSTCII